MKPANIELTRHYREQESIDRANAVGERGGLFPRKQVGRVIWMLASALVLVPALMFAQQYSVDWYKIAAGGGTSTNGQFAVSGTVGQHEAGGPMAGGGYSITGGFWALYAIQTPGAPTLFIMKSGANVVVYWSVSATSFGLVSKSDLAGHAAWSPVATTPVTLNGFNYVTNSLVPGNNFFRLQHQ